MQLSSIIVLWSGVYNNDNDHYEQYHCQDAPHYRTDDALESPRAPLQAKTHYTTLGTVPSLLAPGPSEKEGLPESQGQCPHETAAK